MEATENADIKMPIAAPRRESGKASPTITSVADGANAAERAGDNTAHQQQRIVRRESTEAGAQREASVEHQRQALAVEAIHNERGQQPCDGGANGVSGDDVTELFEIEM